MDPEVKKFLATAARTVNSVCGELDSDISYYQAIYPESRDSFESLKTRILELTKSILNLSKRPEEDADDLTDRVHDTFEDRLEEVDHQFDIFHGRIPVTNIKVQEQPQVKRARLFQTAPAHLTVIRPESTEIFIPEAHPYESLLKTMNWDEYCKDDIKEIPMPRPIEESPVRWVETEEDLDSLVETLKDESIIAVDLEHHSMHSYYGLTCLMQISTLTDDYLIDTIKLRSSIGRLGPIFASPSILKVMHGAESDNIWLQRDFNIFIVSLFDTYFAAKILGLQRFSFAFLMQHYLGIHVDKQHQMSDWRIRPLPKDMLFYAQQDTHYLLHLYSRIRKDLMIRSPSQFTSVLNSSARQCLKLFRPELFCKNDWKSVIQRSSVPFNRAELDKVQALYKWRDETARLADVSWFALMPDSLIIKIAQSPPDSDVGKVLSSTRHHTAIAEKYMDSLREALAAVKPVETLAAPPKQNQVSSLPTHIRFSDEEDQGAEKKNQEDGIKVTSGKIAMATTLKPKLKKGRSLVNAFETMSTSSPTLDLAPVVQNLDIVKVERAANALMMAQQLETVKMPQQDIPDEQSVEPAAKTARILKTGEIVTEEAVLDQAIQHFELNLAKSSATKPIISADQVFNYESRPENQSSTESTLIDIRPSVQPAVKDFKPTFDDSAPTGVTRKFGPRLTTQPRSGNKNRTF